MLLDPPSSTSAHLDVWAQPQLRARNEGRALGLGGTGHPESDWATQAADLA